MTAGICAALLRFIPLQEMGMRFRFGVPHFAGMMAAVLPLCLVTSALQSCVATLARSFKEAQSYMGILILAPMLVGVLGTIYPIDNQPWMFGVPMLGQYVLLTNVLGGRTPGPLAFVGGGGGLRGRGGAAGARDGVAVSKRADYIWAMSPSPVPPSTPLQAPANAAPETELDDVGGPIRRQNEMTDSFDPRLHFQSRRVAETYDQERFASFGDRLFQRAGVRALSRALRVLGSEASLLDAACGTGRFSKALLNLGFHVTCADISHEMIDVAKRRLHGADGRLQFSRGSADALPFCDEAFDAVVSMRFLPHIPTQQRRVMLGEMARVSRRWVVFSNTYSNRWYAIQARTETTARPRLPPTRYPVTEEELHEELRFAGLREAGRFWTWRFLSEEVLVVCEKLGEGDRKLL